MEVNADKVIENIVLTDTDLLIIDMYLHSPDGKLTFYNHASHVINITIRNTTIDDTELEFNGSNISLRIENSAIPFPRMSFHGPSESDQPILIRNCTFDEDTASELKLNRQTFLSFEETSVEFYSCDFIGLKNEDRLIYGSESNITMMNVDVQGIGGTFYKHHGMYCTNHPLPFHGQQGNCSNSLCGGKLRIEDSTMTGNEGEYAGGI